MLVITATSGSVQRDKRSISPGPRMPISITKAQWWESADSTVSGTPMSLLLFPSLQCTSPIGAKAARINSRVVVFPAEPVTATRG